MTEERQDVVTQGTAERGPSRLRALHFPLAIFLIFWTVAIVLWRKTGTIFFLFDLGYIGTSLGVDESPTQRSRNERDFWFLCK